MYVALLFTAPPGFSGWYRIPVNPWSQQRQPIALPRVIARFSVTEFWDMRHVNRTVKEATEIHVHKNKFNRNSGFVLSQAWSFNKHVNKRKTGPGRTGRPTKTVCLATIHRSRRYIGIQTDIGLSVSSLMTRTEMVLGTLIYLAFNQLTLLTARECVFH